MKLYAKRTLGLRLAVGALLAAAALFFAPRLAQEVYAQDEPPSCSVNCSNGSCSASGNCTCTCTFWTRTASCSCSTPPSIQ